MFRRTLFLSLLLFDLASSAVAQCEPQWAAGEGPGTLYGEVSVTTTWDPDGTGPLPPLLVTGGSTGDGYNDRVARVATFDGSDWRVLGVLGEGGVWALAVYNGQLCVGTEHGAYVWSGSAWQQIAQADFVLSLAIYNGELYAGGQFTTLNGAPMAGIARWNGSTWSPVGSGVTGSAGNVWAMAVFQNVLWVGGGFTAAGGIPVSNLAVWNGTTWVAAPPVSGGVEAMAVRIGQTLNTSFLFVGGSISSIGPTPVHNVARFSPVTNTWSALGAGPPGSYCRRLHVRGTGLNSYELTAVTTNYGGQDAVRWDATSSTWVGLGTPPGAIDNSSAAIAYWNGEYVIGRWSMPDDVAIHHVTGGTMQPLIGTGIHGRVSAVLDDGAETILGGDFQTISGLPVQGIAHGSAGNWSSLGGGVDGVVNALVRMPNGDVVAGGSFTQAGGVPAANIARWNGSTWSAIGSGTSGPVLALAVLSNSDLVAGGSFASAGGGLVNRIARWTGAVWTSLGVGFDGDVACLRTLANGDLIAGGAFTNNGLHIARWNGLQWTPIGIGSLGPVTAVTESSAGDLIAAGWFDVVNSVVARWDGSTWVWLGAQPFGNTFPLLVHGLHALPDGDILAAGEPSSGVFLEAKRVQRLRAGSWTPVDIPAGVVWASELGGDGVLRFGGDFDGYDGGIPARFAALVPPCPAQAVSVAAGCPSSGGNNQLVATTLPWVDGTFHATGTGLPTTALVVAVTGFAQLLPPLPLAAVFPEAVAGCDLHVFPDLIQALVTTNGTATSDLLLPNTPSLVGVTFHHQMVPFEVGGAGGIVAITATNALRLTGGIL